MPWHLSTTSMLRWCKKDINGFSFTLIFRIILKNKQIEIPAWSQCIETLLFELYYSGSFTYKYFLHTQKNCFEPKKKML